MCGICGIINFENNGTEHLNVKTMMSLIKHRGPDDEGVFNEDGIALGFVRLSILDLSPLGHQPMISEDGNYVLIYNGEVYNYIELREELITKGYVFKSKTDTEVVLNAFIEWGESCLDRFNGMWSFAIYNRRRKELFCARDRYGVKPFYYFLDDQQFIFASEIPPILAAMGQKGTPNNKAIYDFLVFNRTDQTEDTFFKEIKKLQHGHFLRLEITERRVFDALNSLEPENRPVLKKLKYVIKKWYDLKERVANSSGFGTVEAFREIFTSAIGILSMLLKKFDKRDMNSFSAVYGKGKRGDESEFIDEFKKDPVKMHFSYPTVDTLIEDIDKFVKAHAEPLPTTSPYAQYKVMEMAKKDVVVVLDGQGADESLAGYHYFFGFYFHELFRKFEWIKLVREIFSYLN
ncbi:MAG: asparagine synthase (glutamine-hydrolyzing), partial [Ignavibacteriales bacterium]|nr:asparagine synthase (glutamine-hydrolyzing) [Ignavibacteriales bacterium]